MHNNHLIQVTVAVVPKDIKGLEKKKKPIKFPSCLDYAETTYNDHRRHLSLLYASLRKNKAALVVSLQSNGNSSFHHRDARFQAKDSYKCTRNQYQDC